MVKAGWKNISRRPLVGVWIHRPNADDLCGAHSSSRLRCRLNPHYRAMGSGNAKGCIVRRCLHDDYEQWQHTGSGQLRVERRSAK
jgi:hypothetical protein